MKITSQEEYGLRILLRIARCNEDESMSIQALSVAEGLSPAYVAKLTRILRQAGYINSTPGNIGGYILSKPATEININQVLKTLGGSLFSKEFCNDFTGASRLCTNSVDCSVRSLWQMIQFSVDQLLDKIQLNDLIGTEKKSDNLLNFLLQQHQYPKRSYFVAVGISGQTVVAAKKQITDISSFAGLTLGCKEIYFFKFFL